MRLRDEFGIRDGQATFDFKVTMADGSHPIDETFVLKQTENVTCAHLQSEQRDSYRIDTFCLNLEDNDRMHAAQSKLMQLMANSTGGNDLDFKASANTFVKDQRDLPDSYTLTVYARSHPSVAFVTLGEEQLFKRDEPSSESGPQA